MRFGNTGEGPAEDPECGRPLDLSALRADDALLDALGSGLVRPGEPYEGCAESDRELVAMLAAWVADVRPDESDPLPTPSPTPVTAGRRPPALTAVPARTTRPPIPIPIELPLPSRPATERRRWVLAHFGRRVAVAALLVGLASSGLAAGISDANSGPTSAAVSRIAFAERAQSIAAAAQVTDELNTARTALEQGRREEAAQLINSIHDQLPAVRPDDGRAQLDRDHRRLKEALAASGGPPAAGDLVLAAAPEVNPSDFISGLAATNDAPSGNGSPKAGSGGNTPGGAGPGDGVILAEGSAAPSAGRTAPAAGSATSSTADDAGSAGSAPPAAADENRPSAEGDGSASGSSPSASDEQSTPDKPSTSADQPSTSDTPATSGTPTSPDRPTSSDKPTTSSEQSTTTDTSSQETTSQRPSRTGTSPSTKPSDDSTGQQKASTSTAGNTDRQQSDTTRTSRPTSTSPRSKDFIGPVRTDPTTVPTVRTSTRTQSSRSLPQRTDTRGDAAGASRTSPTQSRSTPSTTTDNGN